MDGQYCVDTSMLIVSNIINLLIIVGLFTMLGILLKRTSTKKKLERKKKDTMSMLDE